MSQTETRTPFLTRVVELFLRGDVAILLIVVSLLLGVVSLWLTPREEEPQIVVPLADVFVSAPGLSAEEVESKVTNRVEKLLYQIDGVEYVYSMSHAGQCIVTVRFYVGEDREDSLVKLYNKIQSNVDQIPPAVTAWVVKPIEVDDVPIVNVTLWSESPRYGDHALRRLAEQLEHELQAIPNTNRVSIIGGQPRVIRIELDPIRLAARQTSALQVAEALRASNVQLRSGRFEQQDKEVVVEAGTFIRDARELGDLVIQVVGDRPVYLKDVATVIDGPAETDSYSWIGFGPAAAAPRQATEHGRQDDENHALRSSGRATHDRIAQDGGIEPGKLFPAVHIAVAKRKGSNAVWVARAVDGRMEELAPTLLPEGVYYRITRDYGETANDKVNELVEALVIAVLTVIGLIGVMIGWRAALVVALAIPVCYSITLFINLLAGYTINRVTLFALILSLGLLVDDPITDVENIARYFAMRVLPPRDSVLRAIQEVRPALILSTLAIIASFLPLMFITGMMGPYMGPMALCVPLTVTISTVVAFVITPWLALAALRKLHAAKPDQDEEGFDITKRPLYRLSRALLGPILAHRWASWATLGGVGLLLVVAVGIPAFRLIPLKMLPYDNKNEFQIVIDMPEGATLEQTNAVSERLAHYVASVAEVRDYQLYVGLASPMDFNGMVRHYFLRHGSNVADIRVNLAPKHQRSQQSHAMVLRIRNDLTQLASGAGAKIKMVEVPPGPPVISTITAEVYGPPDARYDQLIAVSRTVAARMEREPGVVDVDTSAEDDQQKLVFETDKPKAALSDISTQQIAETMRLALSGLKATVVQAPGGGRPIVDRASPAALAAVGPGRPAGDLRARGEGPDGPAWRVGPIRRRDRGQDDLSQKSSPRGLCLRRGGGATAGRCDHRHAVGPASRRPADHAGRLAAAGGRSHVVLPRRRGSLVDTGRLLGRLGGRGRMEDHAGRISRPGVGFRGGAGRHLRGSHVPDRLTVDAVGDHVGDPADAHRHHARLLAAERAGQRAGGRVSQPGVPHGHGHDRHDRAGGNRRAQFGRADRFHSTWHGRRTDFARGDHPQRGRPHAADPGHGGYDAVGQLGYHARSDFLRAGLGHHLRHRHLDALHADRDPDRLLAAVRQEDFPGWGVIPVDLLPSCAKTLTIFQRVITN